MCSRTKLKNTQVNIKIIQHQKGKMFGIQLKIISYAKKQENRIFHE